MEDECRSCGCELDTCGDYCSACELEIEQRKIEQAELDYYADDYPDWP